MPSSTLASHSFASASWKAHLVSASKGAFTGSAEAGHVTIVVWDPATKTGKQYNGGGPHNHRNIGDLVLGAVGTLDPNIKGTRGKITIRDILAMNQKGLPLLVKTNLTYQQEVKALDGAFDKTSQVPVYWAALGPNSNTYAHQLLINAGFKNIPTPPDAPAWNYSKNKYDFGYGSMWFDQYGKSTDHFGTWYFTAAILAAGYAPDY